MVRDVGLKLIEGVQKRAFSDKMVRGIQHCKYDDRLNYIGLMRLERRRVRSDLAETFKIMKEMYDVNRDIFKLDHGGRRGRDQKLKWRCRLYV